MFEIVAVYEDVRKPQHGQQQLLSDLGWIPKWQRQRTKKLNELICCDNLLHSMIYYCARSGAWIHFIVFQQHIFM